MTNVLVEKHGLNSRSNIKEIGSKPGEKLYEELMSEEETGRALETKDYFVVLPAFRDIYPIDYSYDDTIDSGVLRPYKSSEEAMLTQEQLQSYLVEHNII